MWSGPRNISTAMMRSWGNRDDAVVVDEPLYAHYLHVTQKPHPGREEVLAGGDTDWQRVVAGLIGPIPDGKRVYFQKHMTHHLLPHINREWLLKLTNCFLIRHPREVLASYTKVIETPQIEDIGFPQQAEIFEHVAKATGRVPPVLDSADVLRNPRRMLGLLCDELNLDFQESMLSWAPGPRPTDGRWGRYWYTEVDKSTGFRPYQPKEITLPKQLEDLCQRCLGYYQRLYAHCLV
ncbi:MAG: HAD family hydrolase [Planctomycetes bacterium]|nr:HAD family hydrolase [Planctomycetota bacterium]